MFRKTHEHPTAQKPGAVACELTHVPTDGRTVMTKLIVTFRSCATCKAVCDVCHLILRHTQSYILNIFTHRQCKLRCHGFCLFFCLLSQQFDLCNAERDRQTDRPLPTALTKHRQYKYMRVCAKQHCKRFGLMTA